MTGTVVEPTHVWEFQNKKTGETRTYEQSELTIDGEVQLFQMLNRIIITLNKRDFPWDRVYALTDPDAAIDWNEVATLTSIALTEVPSAASEFACVLFGIYPFDEDGKRVANFEDEKAFIRSCITIPRLTDMMQVFMEQNDYERLARPFAAAFRRMTEVGAKAETEAAEPSALPERSTS